MRRVREHIDYTGGLEAIALVVDQRPGIPRQCAGMTGHINDAFRIKNFDATDNLGSATARRTAIFCPICPRKSRNRWQ